MSCYKLYIDNDNLLALDELSNPDTGEFINDATVNVTLYGPDDEELAGFTWPLELEYVTDSNGNYTGTIDADGVAEGTSGRLVITAVDGSVNAEFESTYQFVRRNATQYLTSKAELEDLFGRENIQVWADLENEDDAADILRRIRWAVEEATYEARGMLIGGPSWDACLVDKRLRLATTRSAGVLLYESRGVTDTADDEGRHRLKWHRDRAEKYFQRVAAGLIRVGAGGSPVSYPAVVPYCED